MVSLVNVFLKYTKEFYALTNISLSADKGEVVALCGPKDSGKTCILRILAGLEKVDKGEVFIKDIPLKKVDYSTDVSLGLLPYKTIFFEKKTVYDNLKYVLEVRGVDKAVIEEKINNAIIDFKLESIKDVPIWKLTNYEKYLVSIARLSFRKLEICLIDNIFEELSEEEVKEFMKLFKKYFINKSTLVIIATSSEELAKSIATKIVYLKYGVIEHIDEN